MKHILTFNLLFLIIGAMITISCKKENPVSPVVTPPPPPPPPTTNNLNLIPFDTLSKARYNLVAGAAGNKILFAGGFYDVPRCWYDSGPDMPGWYDCRYESNRVDIFDTSTQAWSIHELGRYYVGTSSVTVGSKVYFAGGIDTSNRSWSDKADIYDASTNSWSIIKLSEPRAGLSVGSLGNKVFFAGGSTYSPNSTVSNKVEIYDVSAISWSTATLSEARTRPAVASVGNKIIFAGGWKGSGPSTVVDIYDASSNTWSVARLSEATGFITAFTIGSEAFFIVGAPGNSIPPPRKIDVYNSSTNSWSVKEIDFFAEGYPSVVMDNKALVFLGRNVRIYNALNGTWADAILDRELGYTTIIGVGKRIYFAGGGSNAGNQTNKIWKLDF